MKMTLEEYQEAEESYSGYCIDCDAITRDETEADAYGYTCPQCDRNEVEGVPMALLEGFIDICNE